MKYHITPNRRAFLDMIAVSEGTSTVKGSDNGYNVMYGGGLFKDYSDHPRKVLTFTIKGKSVSSSAAGRYQLLARYWDIYKKQLGLVNFGPYSQDQVALQQINERRAFPDIDAGRITEAIAKCKNIWASFPGAGYNQHEQKLQTLLNAYVKAGGMLVS